LTDVPWGAAGWEAQDVERARREYEQLAGRTVNQARKRIVELLIDAHDIVGEPTPVTHAGQVLREGRATDRDHHQPPVVRAHGRAQRRADRARARAELAPPYMRARFEDWVNGLTGGLVRQPPALLRRPVPAVVPARPRGRAAPRRADRRGDEQLPVDPSTDVPDGYDAAQRGQRTGSSPTPT